MGRMDLGWDKYAVFLLHWHFPLSIMAAYVVVLATLHGHDTQER